MVLLDSCPCKSCRCVGDACPEPAQPAPATEPLTDGGGQARLHRLLLLLQLREELLGMAADLDRSLGLNVACEAAEGAGRRRELGWPLAAAGCAGARAVPALHQAATCPARIDPPRTLNLAPLPAMETQCLHKALVLLLGPPLALLGDGVGLAGLHGRGAGKGAADGRGKWRGEAQQAPPGRPACALAQRAVELGGWEGRGESRVAAGRGGRVVLAHARAQAPLGRSWIQEDCWRRRPARANRGQMRLQGAWRRRRGRERLPFAWAGGSRHRRPPGLKGRAARPPLLLTPC